MWINVDKLTIVEESKKRITRNKVRKGKE